MSGPTLTIDVRRVAFRFYTYRLQYGSTITVGWSTKSGARNAIAEFCNENSAKPGARKVLV